MRKEKQMTIQLYGLILKKRQIRHTQENSTTASAATGKTFRKEIRTTKTSVQTDLYLLTEQYSLSL